MPIISQVIVWLIVGVIGGSLAGLIAKWRRKGFGLTQNSWVRLVGAVIGFVVGCRVTS